MGKLIKKRKKTSDFVINKLFFFFYRLLQLQLVNNQFFFIKKKKDKIVLNCVFIELAAAATIIKYWKAVLPDAAWSTIFLVIIVGVNFLGVRIYGELEYWFALVKIVIVFVFIIIGNIY